MIQRSAVGVIVFAILFVSMMCLMVEVVAAQGQGQMPEEIEVAPGVYVPCDMWEDDYIPTVDAMTDAGFIESDAVIIASRQCTWSEIKACFMGYYNNCCPKKEDE